LKKFPARKWLYCSYIIKYCLLSDKETKAAPRVSVVNEEEEEEEDEEGSLFSMSTQSDLLARDSVDSVESVVNAANTPTDSNKPSLQKIPSVEDCIKHFERKGFQRQASRG